MNVPKLVAEDTKLFLGLIADIFPGVQSATIEPRSFVDSVREVIHQQKLVEVQSQIDKAVQLYETMQARHATMVYFTNFIIRLIS